MLLVHRPHFKKQGARLKTGSVMRWEQGSWKEWSESMKNKLQRELVWWCSSGIISFHRLPCKALPGRGRPLWLQYVLWYNVLATIGVLWYFLFPFYQRTGAHSPPHSVHAGEGSGAGDLLISSRRQLLGKGTLSWLEPKAILALVLGPGAVLLSNSRFFRSASGLTDGLSPPQLLPRHKSLKPKEWPSSLS